MQIRKPSDTLIVKGDKFILNQCSKDKLKENEIQKIPSTWVFKVCLDLHTSKYSIHC